LGLPKRVEHAICIDTLAYGGGLLTFLEVDSGHYWQTNEAGEPRMGAVD
jgi:serine/threonine protein phosphatase 1